VEGLPIAVLAHVEDEGIVVFRRSRDGDEHSLAEHMHVGAGQPAELMNPVGPDAAGVDQHLSRDAELPPVMSISQLEAPTAVPVGGALQKAVVEGAVIGRAMRHHPLEDEAAVRCFEHAFFIHMRGAE
jgi:hypothetical protein